MSRLESLLDLHRQDPGDSDLLFMIASEHAGEGRPEDAIPWLRRYVSEGRDVGAGWALLARCHGQLGDHVARREALRDGIDAAMRGGHPTLAAELRAELEDDE